MSIVTKDTKTVQPKHQLAFAVWITGLPASGKSTVTAALTQELTRLGVQFAVLESDALRKTLPIASTYDERDREYFYGSLAFIGQVLTQHGISVIFDATANRRSYRDCARQRIAQFAEVFVDCPLDVCMMRDPKGIYRMAREGKASHVPGVQVTYESPDKPEILIHGDRDNQRDGARRIIDYLSSRGWLNRRHKMNREPRRIRPKSLAASAKRRVIKEVAGLPKGSKEMLKGGKGKKAISSPSQPHSKTFGK